MLSAWKITAFQRNCSTAKSLRTNGLVEVRKNRFKYTLKVSMKSFGITPNSLEYLVQDRDKGQEVFKYGVKICETRRNAATELRRKLRKGRDTSATAGTIPCSHYQRFFGAQIGLISYLQTHGSRPQSEVDHMVCIDYDGLRRRVCDKFCQQGYENNTVRF